MLRNRSDNAAHPNEDQSRKEPRRVRRYEGKTHERSFQRPLVRNRLPLSHNSPAGSDDTMAELTNAIPVCYAWHTAPEPTVLEASRRSKYWSEARPAEAGGHTRCGRLLPQACFRSAITSLAVARRAPPWLRSPEVGARSGPSGRDSPHPTDCVPDVNLAHVRNQGATQRGSTT